MESEYFYTVSILIFSHMYKTDPFSCHLVCSPTTFVSDTKWTYCTVLSNNQSKQIILVYYCSNMVWSNLNHNFFHMWILFVINFEFLDGCWLFPLQLSYHWLKNFVAVINRYYLCSVMVIVSIRAHCFDFISPEICELALTYTFLQATNKKIPGVWTSQHNPNVNFYCQWYF
jgi:hypothetical protein